MRVFQSYWNKLSVLEVCSIEAKNLIQLWDLGFRTQRNTELVLRSFKQK